MQNSNTEGLLNSIKSKFTFKFKLLHTFFFSFPTHSTLLGSQEVLHIVASGPGGSHEPLSPFFSNYTTKRSPKFNAQFSRNHNAVNSLKSSPFVETKLFRYKIRHWLTRKVPFLTSALCQVPLESWDGARKHKQTWNQTGLSFTGKVLFRARHYVHGKLNPLPNSQEWLNKSPVHFTLELQTVPQAHLSWCPTVLSFPYHFQRTRARTCVSPGTSQNHSVSTWKSVPGLPPQTTLCTVQMDAISYMVCANMGLEAETELGKSVASQIHIVYTLHCFVVADPTYSDTLLDIPCNCIAHSNST